jgi:hypothetical protein
MAKHPQEAARVTAEPGADRDQPLDEAIAAISAARLTKVQRQPNRPPSQVAMGRPNTVAKVMPLNTTASAWP